jgi:hypothetical protein
MDSKIRSLARSSVSPLTVNRDTRLISCVPAGE